MATQTTNTLQYRPGSSKAAPLVQQILQQTRFELLLTARREIRLIDHERAIGGTGLGLFSTVPPPGPNRLLQMVHKFSPAERAALKAPLREFCAACHAAVFRLPYAQLVSDEALREPVRAYLERRADLLLDTLGQTLGIPDLPGLQPRPLQPPAL